MAFAVSSIRIPSAVRPSSSSSLRPRIVSASRPVLVRAEGPSVERAIEDAEEICKEQKDSKECAVAWEVVEELSADASHKKDAGTKKDPLEEYCEDRPDADECRVYED